MDPEDQLLRAIAAVEDSRTREALILLHREIESHSGLGAHGGIDSRVTVIEEWREHIAREDVQSSAIAAFKKRMLGAVIAAASVGGAVLAVIYEVITILLKGGHRP